MPFPSPSNRRTFLKQSAVSTAAIGLNANGLAQNQADIIKVGQIGTAHAHASGKWRSMHRCDAFEVVGLAEVTEERARAIKSNPGEYAQAPWMSVEALLAIPDLRLVAVETHVRDLLHMATRCLEA